MPRHWLDTQSRLYHLGLCQWKIDITPWGLWIFTPTAIALITLYVAGRIGRTLGEAQTNQLRSIYQSATGDQNHSLKWAMLHNCDTLPLT